MTLVLKFVKNRPCFFILLQERMLHCIFKFATLRELDPELVLVDGGCISPGHCTGTGQDCQESSGNIHSTTFL